jgi:hypothetical protein
MSYGWRPGIGCLVALFVAFLAIGCNRENLPGLGRVTGTVTLDGKPVPDATITFEPQGVNAGTSIGRTDATGKYELYYSRDSKGAAQGEHLVRINTFQDAGEDSGQKLQLESIPAKYNVRSELKVNVKGGTQVHDFALKSGGEIIQPEGVEPATGKKKARSVTGCW